MTRHNHLLEDGMNDEIINCLIENMGTDEKAEKK